MTIASYSDLKSAVSNWLITTYADARIAEWIALGEAEVNKILVAKGGIRDMEQSADLSLTASTRTVSLPTRFAGARRLYLNTDPIRKLEFVTPVQYWETFLSTDTGKPRAFTIEADDVVFGPIPDTTYTGKLLYFQKFAPLSDSVTSNDLLTNNPDIYLTATLKWAWTFKAATEPEGTTWDALMNNAIDQAIAANKRDRFGGDALKVRMETPASPHY